MCGQGIFKALRGDVFVSYAIADSLRQTSQNPVVRFLSFVKREFAAYIQTLTHRYDLEKRWMDALSGSVVSASGCAARTRFDRSAVSLPEPRHVWPGDPRAVANPGP